MMVENDEQWFENKWWKNMMNKWWKHLCKNIMNKWWTNDETSMNKPSEKIKNNWLYTGDIGKLDKDNHLIITDRKKDIIVTTGGDNIAPQKIESLFATLETTAQVLVFGDNKPFLVALIIHKKDKNTSLVDVDNENKKIDLHIKRINKKLSPIEKIRKIGFVIDNLDQKSGFLTPTMKIKRKKVYEKYRKNIEKLYN